MSDRKLLGGSPVGAVSIVERPVSQWYAQRARVTFAVVALVSAVVTAAVVSVFAPLLLAIPAGVLAGLVVGFVAAVLVRVWPVLRVLWWWLFELSAAAVLLVGWSVLARQVSPWFATSVLLVAVLLVVVVAPVRRFVAAWLGCVVVRHRLRSCFAGIVRGSGGVRPGSLPLVLWARPTPAGQRVWLWLRPGLELADLDNKCGRIAVACIAKQVRVVAASERYAALIRVDVARRDPLAVRIDSPLALLIPSLRTGSAEVPVLPAVPLVGLELADIEEPAPEPRGGRR